MIPITWKNGLKLLGWGLVFAAILFLGSAIYGWIFDRGANSIQVKWDQETAEYTAEIDRLKTEFEQQERDHRTTNRKLNDELSQARLEHREALASAERDYTQRLQRSEQRAAIYQRQAQGGTPQCGDLASHAARLDGTLEEGRYLVRELRETLGLREREIHALSQQIRNDRTLIEEEKP